MQETFSEQVYSKRARVVVFIARHLAGEHGSATVQVDHLALGFIHEDQSGEALALAAFGRTIPVVSEVTPRDSFIPQETASRLLAAIVAEDEKAPPISPEVGIPLSANAKAVLYEADRAREALGGRQVEPLHVLIGVLKQDTRGSRALREAGITEDAAMTRLRERGNLRA